MLVHPSEMTDTRKSWGDKIKDLMLAGNGSEEVNLILMMKIKNFSKKPMMN